MCTISKVIGINKEREICLPNREYMSSHTWERINMVVKCIEHMHITAELKAYGLLVLTCHTAYSLSDACFVGLLFLFIETKELCEARAKTWNELKSGRQTYFGQCPPIWSCLMKKWQLCISIPSMRTHSKQSIDEKVTGDVLPPPFEHARAQSDLFAVQCGQWEPIWNSQLIRKYKKNTSAYINI